MYWSKMVATVAWKALIRVQQVILIAVGFWVTVGVFVEVVGRYVFHTGIMFGFDELSVFPVFWMYMIGAAYATYENSHLKAEVTAMMGMSPRTLGIVKVVVSLIAFALICYILCTWGYNHFVWLLVKHEVTHALRLPLLFVKSSIFFGLILITLYLAIQFITSIGSILHR